MRPHTWCHSTRTSNFLIGFAPPKKTPATHKTHSKTLGKMLLGSKLAGVFSWGGKPTGKLQFET